MKLRINVFHPSKELHSPSYPGGKIMMRYSFQNVKMSQILIYYGSLGGSYVLTLENAHFCIKLRVERFAKWWRITICICSNEGSIHLCGVIAGSNSKHIEGKNETTHLKWGSFGIKGMDRQFCNVKWMSDWMCMLGFFWLCRFGNLVSIWNAKENNIWAMKRIWKFMTWIQETVVIRSFTLPL